MKPIRLNEMFPDWFTGGGIFGALAATGNAPWGTDNALQFDHAYHGNHSGMKRISPLLLHYARANEGEPLTEAQREAIAATLLAVYGENWAKLFATLELEYNPIENYDMVEEETPAETTDTITPAETTVTTTPEEVTRTTTPAETTVTTTPAETTRTTTPAETTETRTDAGYTDTTDEEVSKYGFNENATAVPTDASERTVTHSPVTDGSTVTTTQSAETETLEADNPETVKTEVDASGSDSVTVDNPATVVTKVDSAETHVHTTQESRVLTRHGNIGVTTSQQMIQSERELWVWNIMQDRVFADIDKYLTIPIF